MESVHHARPLAGVQVVDRTEHVGEWCGRILADLGAEVVRLEPPSGAVSRRRPPLASDGTSLWWLARNHGKHRVRLDDPAEADRWLAGADVLVDSTLSAAEAARLAARFPHLIITSITWCGLSGPYADWPANDDVVTALSGWLASAGRSSELPVLVPGSLPSDGASVMAVFATLAALWQRPARGAGQVIDLSALEATIQLDAWSLSNASANRAAGVAARRIRSGEKQIYPVVPGTDGWARLVMIAPRQWRAFLQWAGSPPEFADPYWEAPPNRFANADVLTPLFRDHFRDMTIDEASVEAQARGVVVTPMSSPAQLLADEHLRSRGTFATVDTAAGAVPMVLGLFEIDRTRVGTDRPAATTPSPRPPVPPPTAVTSPTHPFAGLKVVDFGHGGVGVQAGRLLAEHGADVIKVESRTYLDFMRIMSGTEMSPSFAASSRSKRSFGVNLKDPAGVELVKRLVAWADVVIENNSTGTMHSLGLDHEALSAVNPRLVYVSSQLLGSTGLRSNWSGYGPSVQAYGGLSFLWRHPGTEPPAHMAIHPDMMAGHLCAVAALAGLLGRVQSGRGAHCEVAQVEAVIATLNDLLMAEALVPGSVHPDGNDDARGAPWGVFATAGDHDHIVVCVETDEQWRGLCRAMGHADADSAHATAAARLADRDAVNALVARWARALDRFDAAARCRREGVPAAPMLYAAELLDDPHVVARGFGVAVEQPGFGSLVLEGSAFAADGMAPAIGRPAPALGEHTRDVAREVLGLAPDVIGALIAQGVLEE